MKFKMLVLLGLLAWLSVYMLNEAKAQWTNHYQKLEDFGHHVYLEQHELPILAHGITDPAPSPDGKRIAFSSKGWLWLYDIQSGVATRFTDASAADARPRWSTDGNYIAFVRDYGSDTAIVIKNTKTKKETVINTPAIELDPEFSSDGLTLFYSSGISGSLDLYRYDITSETKQKISALAQVERNVRRVANKDAIVYLHGAGAHRVLRMRDFTAGGDEIVQAQTLTYHLSADVHPKQALLVYSAPIDNDYHLYTMDLNEPRVSQRLTDGNSFALTPAFSADGREIYFVSLDENRQFVLMKINTYGGEVRQVKVKEWDYGTPTANLALNINDDQGKAVAARVSIVAESGHPVANPFGASFDDPQSGRSYFYVDGNASFTLPIGKYSIEAVRGPMTPLVKNIVQVSKNKKNEASLTLSSLWEAQSEGYVSADFHVHLNGDGHHRATHKDALSLMKGEDLDYLAPMSWNRWERKIDKHLIGKRSTEGQHTVVQGQEVRSHFHGHVGLLNVNKAFTPWFFGPNNPALGDINLSNSDVFAYARDIGAFATYVHPIAQDGNPFTEQRVNAIPLELLSDGILEPRMGLELVCAWTSSLGTAELWYRLLNIGRPVAGISGTDSWVDFHRTPAVGTGRAYVRPLENASIKDAVLAGAAAGRSFLSTGPALVFSLDNGAQPGDVTSSGTQAYSLMLASAVELEVVEILINGQVVQTLEGIQAGTSKAYAGEITLPEGGWLAARAYAAEQRDDSWPSMHARPFAHSSPIWINQIGSIDEQARKTAAKDLLLGINAAEQRARVAYGTRQVPKLFERFEKARALLQTFL